MIFAFRIYVKFSFSKNAYTHAYVLRKLEVILNILECKLFYSVSGSVLYNNTKHFQKPNVRFLTFKFRISCGKMCISNWILHQQYAFNTITFVHNFGLGHPVI